MKDLFKLWFIFFKLGLINFGGGYAMLPLLEKELVTKRGWITLEEITDYYAVGQCTPGAIAINVSTFIGYKRKGVLGGIFATLGFIAPAFFIIFIIAALLQNFASNPYVINALAGIRVCVFVLIVYAVTKLVKKSLIDFWTIALAILVAGLAIFVEAIPLYCYVIFAAIYGFIVSLIKQKKLKNKEKELQTSETTEASEINENIENEEDAPKKTKITLSNVLSVAIGSAFLILIVLVCALFVIFDNGNTKMLELFGQFFKIGVCAFGGGLATIPFLSELGTVTGWFTQTDLANMIAVSESTPGAIGINMSTYVGYIVGGIDGNFFTSIVGSLAATIGFVAPSVIVIEIIYIFLQKFKDNKYVKWVFYGLRAGSIGLICSAAYEVLCISLFNTDIISAIQAVSSDSFLDWLNIFFDTLINWKSLAVGTVFFVGVFKFKKHPLIYISIAAIIGIILQMGV